LNDKLRLQRLTGFGEMLFTGKHRTSAAADPFSATDGTPSQAAEKVRVGIEIAADDPPQ